MASTSSPKRCRTKIVATIGPACRSVPQLTSLVNAGVDVFRVNMAHGSIAEHTETVGMIRQVSRELDRPIGILVDLGGPKIRLGELPGGQLDLAPNASVRFVRGGVSEKADELICSYEPLVDEVKVGNMIMLADGCVSLLVEEKGPKHAQCRVIQAGLVRSRQGVNLPGAKLSVPSMSEADWVHAQWAAEINVDFVSLSFVRTPVEVRLLKELLRTRGSRAKVIAKIEKQEAIDELDAIVEAADGVMVARGDLGVEIDVAKMPVVQKRIISACHTRQKPVIVATQMLDSMQNSRRPTRAEVTDVANAILDGGDACMLSGETAIGLYPREAVEMMSQVAEATEELFRDRAPLPAEGYSPEGLHPITGATVLGAGQIAAKLSARLNIVVSHSGATALAISKQRNFIPTVGVSDSETTLRQMCLYWGVIPMPAAPTASSAEVLDFVTAWGLESGRLSKGDHLVLVAGVGLGTGSHNFVRVHQVE